MHYVLSLLAICLSLIGTARADWLTTVWPKTPDTTNGNPAITLNADAVIVVLPEAVLEQAHSAGLSVAGAVGSFLARYAPKMCSSVLDMSAAHRQLRVELRVQRPAALEALDEATQNAAALALNRVMGRSELRSTAVPRIDKAFVVDKDGLTLSIDYVPEKISNCVVPPDAIF